MSKTQGFIPVYDPATKRILGGYTLSAQRAFEGDEVSLCLVYGATPDDTRIHPEITERLVHGCGV
jgi:hypothetical protein